MLELKTGNTSVMRTKKPLLGNVWLTSATNKPLVRIHADQIHADVFQTVEQVKSEMLDLIKKLECCSIYDSYSNQW